MDVVSPLNARDDAGGEASAEEGATTTGPRLVKPDEDDHDDDHDDDDDAQLCAASRPGVHLGKRDRPDGRVLMPPRKRYEFGGDDDPGFDPG